MIPWWDQCTRVVLIASWVCLNHFCDYGVLWLSCNMLTIVLESGWCIWEAMDHFNSGWIKISRCHSMYSFCMLIACCIRLNHFCESGVLCLSWNMLTIVVESGWTMWEAEDCSNSARIKMPFKVLEWRVDSLLGRFEYLLWFWDALPILWYANYCYWKRLEYKVGRGLFLFSNGCSPCFYELY